MLCPLARNHYIISNGDAPIFSNRVMGQTDLLVDYVIISVE